MNQNKIFADFHLHSEFSADCETDVRNLIGACRKAGLNMICLTDHNDLDFPDTPDHIRFDLDMPDYMKTLSALREELLPEFDLRIGVEQGVMPSTCSKLSDFSLRYPGLDFIICSSHVVKGQDPWYPETFINPDGSPKDPREVYESCFEDILYNVRNFMDYNIYGHLDYVFRYGPRHITGQVFEEEFYEDIKDILHDILKTIIENGKGIEINTGSLYRGMDYAHPHILILKMYRQLGGEILTIGSDAHDLIHPGYAFDKARELALEAGFKAFCTFKDMKPEFHDL